MLVGQTTKIIKERNWGSWVFDKLMKYRSEISPNKQPLLMWMVDKQGVFTMSEGEGLSKLGQKPGEVIGQSVYEVYAEYSPIINNVRLALDGKANEGVVHFGNLAWNVHYNPIHGGNSEIVGAVGVAFDITEWQNLYRAQEIIVCFASELRKAVNRSDMIPIVTSKLTEIFDAKNCALLSLNPNTGELVDEYMHGNWEFEKSSPHSSYDDNWLALDSKRILETSEPFTDKKVYGCSKSPQVSYISGVPLIANYERIGVLWIGRNEPIVEDEVQLLADIGELMASALYRATQHELTERRLQRITALHAIDKVITGSLDLHVTMSILLDQVVRQLEVDAANVFLHDAGCQILRFENGLGFNFGSLTENTFRLGEGLAGRVASDRNFIHIEDLSQTEISIVRKSLITQEKFVSYFGIPMIARGKLKGVLELFHRQPLAIDSEWLDFLKALATQAALAINTADLFENIQQSNADLNDAYTSTLEGWVRALDLRDKETEGHTQRVSKRTVHLGRLMGICEEDLVHVRRGALLHDIGKIGIPDNILKKPGPLTDDETEFMRKHPIYSYEMLNQIDYLRPALEIPYYHHEKWDGSGYPKGLKGTQIPLAARIFAVIDVWDALSSNRPYRQAWPEEKIYRHILEQSDEHFDPQVVEAWVNAFDIPTK